MSNNLEKLKQYIDILDNYICFYQDNPDKTCLTQKPHHTTSPELLSGDSGPTLMLSKHINFDNYNQNQLLMLHSLCHLFKDTGAIGIKKHDIKKSHDEIVLRLKSHERFDRLDE